MATHPAEISAVSHVPVVHPQLPISSTESDVLQEDHIFSTTACGRLQSGLEYDGLIEHAHAPSRRTAAFPVSLGARDGISMANRAEINSGVFVKRRRPLQKRTRMFDRRRHAMEISTSDHISVRRRSRSRVTASVASAAVPPRARGCVSMWGSPTSRHATSARARASSNHAACASLLRWSLSLARALSPSSSRPSRRAAPQLAGTLLYRLLY
jgi:hypothetical protein